MLTPQLIERLTAVGDFFQSAAAIATVPGWLHELEGYALMSIAALDPGAGAVAEIGSFKGRSTCWLAAGIRQRLTEHPGERSQVVYAIDHFTGSPEHQPGGTHPDADIAAHGSTLPAFRANISRLGLAEHVHAIELPSLRAASAWNRGPIRLLFIDGDHSYEASKADFEAWQPHLAPGAVVGFHDVGAWEGVSVFYEELMTRTPGLVQEAAINSLRLVRMPG